MNKKDIRSGCKDIWNSFMAEGAIFESCDIPWCPTTAKSIPHNIITWTQAVTIYNVKIKEDKSFYEDSFICFYIDDHKFDGPTGIWHNPQKAINIFHHFGGIITPDFSTYQDFPDPIKRYATYRMRLMGYWAGKNGIPVINNVRWGTEESWEYSFSGLPHNSMLAIGTVGGSPRKIIDRDRFEQGLEKLVKEVHPSVIIVYGSSNYNCFKKLEEAGIKIVSFQSQTASAFERRNNHE